MESSNASLGDFVLLDDLFRLRAADSLQLPLLAFPKSEKGTHDFEHLTGQVLNRFVDRAAKHYMKSGLQAVSVILLNSSDTSHIGNDYRRMMQRPLL